MSGLAHKPEDGWRPLTNDPAWPTLSDIQKEMIAIAYMREVRRCADSAHKVGGGSGMVHGWPREGGGSGNRHD